MKILLMIFSIFIQIVFADCSKDVTDLTKESNVDLRKQFIERSGDFVGTQNGVRIAFNGMKEMNNFHGLGGVNNSLGCVKEIENADGTITKVNGYEGDLRDRLTSSDFKKNNPNVDFKIYKTDFKGYFITCSPMPSCSSIISKEVSKVPSPTFPEIPAEKLEGKSKPNFFISSLEAESYREGYIRARAKDIYGEINLPLNEFIEQEMNEAIKEATGNSPDKVSLSPSFNEELRLNIDKFRTGGIESVDPKLRRLVNALDTLLETPFANADNIEEVLSDAVDSNNRIATAQTGDDLFVVIKDKNGVEKIIGADARGLGITNMTTRLDEFVSRAQSGRVLSTVDDIYDLSVKAMNKADDIMEKSLSTYNSLLKAELADPRGRSIDQMIKSAHDNYHQLSSRDPNYMQIRAGAINDCGNHPKKIMDRITAIHNRLKLMEKANIEGFFGMSCLGTEYFLRKAGLK